MESSIAANSIFFPLKSKRANPYATTADEITVPIVATMEINSEF